MNVNVEEMGVAVEESVPEGGEGQGSPGEEHESDPRNSPVGVLLFLGDQGSPPEKLLIRQGMADVGGMQKRLHIQRTRRRRRRRRLNR